MRFAINHISAPKLPLAEFFAMCRRLGVSEVGAGSDVASLKTSARSDGDDYVIHGHKIWTSYSDVADWCLVLARTDKDVPKHKGISAFIVTMHQDGIEQRPLKMISGVTKEFGQVTKFATPKGELSADKLARCNAAA